MAQFYTLDEAARVLGMNPEDLKAEAQAAQGPRVPGRRNVAIPRRRRGRTGPPAGHGQRRRAAAFGPRPARRCSGGTVDRGDRSLRVPARGCRPRPGRPDDGGGPRSISRCLTPGDQDILLDDLSLPPTTMASSSVIIGMQTTGGRMPSDSDVRLIPDNTGSGSRPSDSDVRLAPPGVQGGKRFRREAGEAQGEAARRFRRGAAAARRFRRDPDRRRFVGARLALRSSGGAWRHRRAEEPDVGVGVVVGSDAGL